MVELFIEQTLNNADSMCRHNGTKLTAKRRLVLSTLIGQQKALSAYDVADRIREAEGSAPPTMSIYRILEFLENQNLVHKLRLANKYIACSHINCEHSHSVQQFLICQKCDEVKEISVHQNIIDALRENVSNAGFLMSNPQLEMNCVCIACSSGSDS